MSNTLGLTLLGLFIGGIILYVVLAQYLAERYPDTAIGKIAKAIDDFIERLPGD